MQFLTVDPGMNTGWSIWDFVSQKPLKYGQIRVGHSKLEDDLQTLFERFSRIDGEWSAGTQKFLSNVYIEYPGVWQNSFVSTAAMYSGDLIKLAAIVGGFVAIAYNWRTQVSLIPPQRWKGQLSKEAIKMRVERSTGIKEKSSHINDALGIGLFVTGQLVVPNSEKPFQ